MRLLVEILIIGGLIYLGWDKPLKQWAAELRAKVPTKQTAAIAQETEAAPATPVPGAWRWDPNHRSVLDRPAYDQTGPAPQATPPRYQDGSGRSYWIDATGVRHYDQ